MSYFQGNDNRLITGGIKGEHRGKRKYELGGPFTATTVSEQFVVKKVRGRGGNFKIKVVKASFVNVALEAGKVVKAKILGVERTPANLEYARRGILTRGTLVKTELGLVRITSRPGQHGGVNGVLVQKEEMKQSE